ncbi:methyltransferase domain-containing protein [Candidatus Gottesmanbacteria bacterium]|nr:methyltransferase domain-containing protein [Candidatus Gottesmanbacteria bacterium]
MPECNVCKSTNIIEWKKIDKYKLLKCNQCLIIQTFPQLSESELEYINNRFYGRQPFTSVAYNTSAEFFFKRGIKFYEEIKLLKIKGKKLLDIGSGYGYNQLVARNNGLITIGIDLSKNAVEFARNIFNLNVIQESFYAYNFKNSKFSIITMYDSLEHVRNPKETIKKVNKLLSDDGYLILQTPNIDSIMYLLTKSKWVWLLLPFHFYHFTSASISKILSESGFRIVKIYTSDDRQEFIKNILWIIKIREDGKLRFFYKPLYIFLHLPYFLNWIWNLFNKGGLLHIYAQKI